MNIGKKIEKRRQELGLSQMQAIKTGYKSRSSINKIELGINKIIINENNITVKWRICLHNSNI